MLGCYPEGLEHGPGLHDSLENGPNGFPKHFGPFFGLGGSAERIDGEAKDVDHKDW